MSKRNRSIKCSVGDVFAYWTVVSEPRQKIKRYFVDAQCLCGTRKELAVSSLIRGSTKSCGCGPVSLHEAKIMSRVQKKEGCWSWLGAHDINGYGSLVLETGSSPQKAHRLVYQLLAGEIAPGLSILHLCDTPGCVNPAHLRPGTQAENVRDMVSKGRHINGRKVAARKISGENFYATKLKEESVKIIRDSKESVSALAEKYGVSVSTIYAIRSRQNWRHVA